MPKGSRADYGLRCTLHQLGTYGLFNAMSQVSGPQPPRPKG